MRGSANLADDQALVAEVGNQLEPAAESGDVAGEALYRGAVGLPVLDLANAGLADPEHCGDLLLGQVTCAADLGKLVGADLSPQLTLKLRHLVLVALGE